MLLKTSTEKDAVNTILTASGDSPTNTLTGAIRPQVAAAYAALVEATRDVLTVGWNFNTDYEYLLQRDVNGEILIPDNILAIDVSPIDADVDLVQRQGKLYDRTNKTFTLAKDYRCDITWFQQFEELPQSARAYITRKAGKKYQGSTVGSDILYQFTAEDENEALITFKRNHEQSEDNNMLRGSYTVSRVVRRNPNNADL